MFSPPPQVVAASQYGFLSGVRSVVTGEFLCIIPSAFFEVSLGRRCE